MSSVDDRIVNMQFNNKQFQSGAAESTKSLETLEKTIGGMGKGTGLNDMGKGVDGLSGKFGAMRIAGVTAIATIANKAVNAGLQLVKSLTVDPLIAGFKEYEKQLNSTQTILANTGLEGQKGLNKVNVSLKKLNDYSDLTIYNFGQMADSVGKFTAAGVPLKESVSAIKGLANTAALSGSNVQQLNTAMYQMSQALSTGTIRLMDWNSLANAGMGGKNIREALQLTNRTLGDHGKAMDASIKKNGNFRDSLRDGWLSAKTFTKTMKVMAGTFDKELNKYIPYTVEALKKMGYSDAAAKQLNKLSKAAIESATKVKTFSQLIDVVKESIGSGFAKIFMDLFGDFGEATKMWTAVSEAITGTVGKIFKSVDEMLVGWKKLGGFQDLWGGFADIFKTIGNLISPFVKAFQAVAPASGQAGAGLAKVTGAFAAVTGWMEKATRGLNVLTPILKVVFSVFKQVGAVASAVWDGLSPLVDLFSSLTDKLSNLNVVGNATGGWFNKFAALGESITAGLAEGINIDSIKMVVEKFATSIVDWIKGALGIASPAAELVPVGESIVQGIVQGISNAISFVIESMKQIVGAVFGGLGDLFKNMDTIDWVTFFNTVLLGGLLVTLYKFVKNLASSLGQILAPFDQLTNTLKTMQSSVKATMILQIAVAVGLLVASLYVLSKMEPKKIGIGLAALGGMLAVLVGAVEVLGHTKTEKVVGAGAAIVAISGAMLVLSGAIAILGNMDIETLRQGLGGFAIALGIMVVWLNTLSGIGPGIAAAGVGIVLVATAMNILAGAIAILGNLDVKTLGFGLGAMAIGLGLITNALAVLTFLGPGAAAAGLGIFIVAAALLVMAKAIDKLGALDNKTLFKGLGTMAIALIMVTNALAVLTFLGPGALGAAGAIIIVAASMLVLAKALTVLGQLSLAQLWAGLSAIAVALTLFLVAGAAAAYVAPGLIILAGSLLAVGAATLLFGTGLFLAATAFGLFVAAGTAGVALLGAAFTAFMALLPAFAVELATAIVLFIETIASMAPRLRVAFSTIIGEMLGTVQDAVPKLAALATELINALIGVLTKAVPKVGKLFETYIREGLRIIRSLIPDIVETGWAIVTGLLRGMEKHIPEVITSGKNIIISVIKGIGKAAVEIANAAGQTVLDFINGLTAAIETYAGPIREAGMDLAMAIIDGLTGGLLGNGIQLVKNAITTLANSIPGPIRKLLGIESPSKVAQYWGEMIVAGLVKGISDNIKNAVGATVALANAVIAAGDKKVAEAQKLARKRQIQATKAAAKAQISDTLAKRAERVADKNPDNKELQAAAKKARAIADAQAKAAEKAQKVADAAATHVQNVKEFNEADAQGKGDILTDRATRLSDRAVEALARANAEANAAKKLHGKEREEMLKRAREDAKLAKDLAARSKAATDQANKYYEQSVNDRIKSIEKDRADQEKAAADQAAFDKATPNQQVAILKAKSEAAQARSDAALKESEALIERAKKLAKTDARKAQELLDKAEALAEEADTAAADAQSYANEAKNVDASGGNGSGFQLSTSAMEDAAKTIDRYTESLQAAEEAAAAATPVYQFVQNNTSPESLSDSEVYRQTKNLLSVAEIKMGA